MGDQECRIEIRYKGAMLYSAVDISDYQNLCQFKWYVRKKRHDFYACRSHTPVRGERQVWVDMHREILGLSKGDGLFADHVNGDTLDNRRANLRVASSSQNAANRKIYRGKVDKGIYFRKGAKKWPWEARIRVSGRLLCLGSFATKEESMAAYDAAAKKYFGEFARPNISTPESN